MALPKHRVHIYIAHLILNIYIHGCVPGSYIIYIQDKMGDYWTPPNGFPKHGFLTGTQPKDVIVKARGRISQSQLIRHYV